MQPVEIALKLLGSELPAEKKFSWKKVGARYPKKHPGCLKKTFYCRLIDKKYV